MSKFNREKSITIPELLFAKMAMYCLFEDQRTPERLEEIRKGVYDKIDRQTNHNLYTTSKTAPTEEQREKARKEYLDRVGISEGFRW